MVFLAIVFHTAAIVAQPPAAAQQENCTIPTCLMGFSAIAPPVHACAAHGASIPKRSCQRRRPFLRKKTPAHGPEFFILADYSAA
jgi:hypothetical protein